jgi:hypothetical protein
MRLQVERDGGVPGWSAGVAVVRVMVGFAATSSRPAGTRGRTQTPPLACANRNRSAADAIG